MATVAHARKPHLHPATSRPISHAPRTPKRSILDESAGRREGVYAILDKRTDVDAETGCHDNAVMESFFSTVKSELAERFPSFGEAKMEIFDYIEVFYNQRRRHSTLGQISPAAFERRAAA